MNKSTRRPWVLLVALLLSSCGEQQTTPPQQSLLRFPKTVIHAAFLRPSRLLRTIPVAGNHTSREGRVLAHRGIATGLAPEGQSATLWWEFVGQSQRAPGDVYLFKFTDPVRPEAGWVKTLVYAGAPIIVVDSADIRVWINESEQAEQSPPDDVLKAAPEE